MVKSPSERSKKYEAKFDAEVVSKRFTNVKDIAVNKAQVAQNALATAGSIARSAMEDNGIPAILSGFFQSFANMCAGLKLKYGTGNVCQTEVGNSVTYWLNSFDYIWSNSPKVKTTLQSILTGLEIPYTIP
jgi:hypothetical protein